jgi:hypothetical protein
MKRAEVNHETSDLRPRLRVAEGSAPAVSSALGLETGYPEEVVGGHGEEELSTHAHPSSEPCLAHPCNRLGPAQDLFDSLPLALTQSVPAASRRAAIQNRRDPFFLCNVRDHALFGHAHLELADAVPLVRPQSHSPTRSVNRPSNHRQSRFRLCSAFRRMYRLYWGRRCSESGPLRRDCLWGDK